jgi:hypothetical protein
VSPLASTIIDGALAQAVAGASGYVFWNESVYAEAGFYRSAKQGVTNPATGGAGPLDGTTSNVIDGVSPYGRLAYEHDWGNHSLELGAYGIEVKLLPGGSPAAPAVLAGPHNRFRDIAFDLQYQYLGITHLFTAAATRIHESQDLLGSFAAGASSASRGELTTTRAAATYYYRRKIGGTLSVFSTTGSSDRLLYPAATTTGVVTSASGSPDTRGSIAEIDYLPWLNVKVQVQYTAYSTFNGGTRNYDGLGRNAHDNDTLYVLLWLAY